MEESPRPRLAITFFTYGSLLIMITLLLLPDLPPLIQTEVAPFSRGRRRLVLFMAEWISHITIAPDVIFFRCFVPKVAASGLQSCCRSRLSEDLALYSLVSLAAYRGSHSSSLQC